MLDTMAGIGPTAEQEFEEAAGIALRRGSVRLIIIYAREWQRRALEASRLRRGLEARKCREERDAMLRRAREVQHVG